MLWLLMNISLRGFCFFLLCAPARQLEQKDLRLAGEEKLHLRLKATVHGIHDEVDNSDGYADQSENQVAAGRK